MEDRRQSPIDLVDECAKVFTTPLEIRVALYLAGYAGLPATDERPNMVWPLLFMEAENGAHHDFPPAIARVGLRSYPHNPVFRRYAKLNGQELEERDYALPPSPEHSSRRKKPVERSLFVCAMAASCFAVVVAVVALSTTLAASEGPNERTVADCDAKFQPRSEPQRSRPAEQGGREPSVRSRFRQSPGLARDVETTNPRERPVPHPRVSHRAESTGSIEVVHEWPGDNSNKLPIGPNLKGEAPPCMPGLHTPSSFAKPSESSEHLGEGGETSGSPRCRASSPLARKKPLESNVSERTQTVRGADVEPRPNATTECRRAEEAKPRTADASGEAVAGQESCPAEEELGEPMMSSKEADDRR